MDGNIDILAVKDYLRKLQKVVNFEYTFSFLGYRLIQKSKIDDILCCVYAKLPDSYKKMLKTKVRTRSYKSISNYEVLVRHLAKTCFWDKSLCLIKLSEVNNLMSAILTSIERDIDAIEKLFYEGN